MSVLAFDLLVIGDGVSSLRVRGAMLLGLVAVMFAASALALFLGKQKQRAANAKALSADTGSAKGAKQGSDQTHSADWLAEASAQDEAPAGRQAWQDAFLGGGSFSQAPVTAPVSVSPAGYPVDPAYAPVPPVSVPGSRRADVPVDSPPTLAPAPPAAPAPEASAPVAPVASAYPPPARTSGGDDAAAGDWWQTAVAEDDRS